MPVKRVGIYLAYAPTINLQYQGLGRYLACFLKAATRRTDIRIIIACPSWMRESLLEMCNSEGIATGALDFVSPPGKPLLLRAHERYVQRKGSASWIGRIVRWRRAANAALEQHRLSIERQLATSRSIWQLLGLGAYIAALCILLSPIVLLMIAKTILAGIWRAITGYLMRTLDLQSMVNRAITTLVQPKNEAVALRLYRFMEQHETDVMVEMINRLTDVDAWYSPTAFWPSFNKINAPRVMCVPDVVLGDFPVGFSGVGGDRFRETFRMVEAAIQGSKYFVTYSNDVKWRTLVETYGVSPGNVSVVKHAVNDLNDQVNITGFANNEVTRRLYAESLFRAALNKASNLDYTASFANLSVKFIVYPSQFRPSKNVINLLRAFSHLLRERYVGHKLILTGNPADMPEINRYIREHNLANDVLCLYGLTTQELAACYSLADLAVNPSLSEGGCPFTFGEALSVGTPAVMARIPVTEEVITDRHLQSVMLFDPYDWRSMAERIEWALQNRGALLAQQLKVFDSLARRTWDNVVAEHIDILNRISASHPIPAGDQQ
ncbi:glycosyltransferase [Bradyrhizobium diazoefficiens]|nr:glycosyltransferase [Bradyrhizobium diazoefficiens]MBR0850299.1 glycosyltransferase [Bradyrhizobium diazoefficiens]